MSEGGVLGCRANTRTAPPNLIHCVECASACFAYKCLLRTLRGTWEERDGRDKGTELQAAGSRRGCGEGRQMEVDEKWGTWERQKDGKGDETERSVEGRKADGETEGKPS